MTEVAHVGFVSLDKELILRNGLSGEAVHLRDHAVIGQQLTDASTVELTFVEGYGMLYINDAPSGYISDMFTHAMYEEKDWFFHEQEGATVWVDRTFWSVDFVRVQLCLETRALDVTANHFKAYVRGC
eukprot:6459303-Amphidinium_carterae.1